MTNDDFEEDPPYDVLRFVPPGEETAALQGTGVQFTWVGPPVRT